VVAGVVVAIGFVVPLSAAVAIGQVVDRFDVRVAVPVGALLLMVAPIPVALAPSVLTLVLLTVLTNCGHVAVIVASQWAVA
jgi:MFS family permease